jgi:hypothetical protein
MLALAAAIYLSAFTVLIETWRRIIAAWGEHLGFLDAASIFFVSSLVRYLPGNTVLQLGAMAELSRRRRVSPLTATSASLINTAVAIASGVIVALVASFAALDTLTNHRVALGLALAAAALAGVFALPFLLPRFSRAIERLTGRQLRVGDLPISAIYLSLIGNVVAWVLYGLSYRTLAIGLLGTVPGSISEYISVYAAAYVMGYLVFFAPAGFGAREGVQISALPALGLLDGKQATVLAAAARLLSMLLEIVPGLLFLSRGTAHASPNSTDRHGPTR